jgi:RNA polymerase sigma factor (sigma-70 family)
LPEDPLRDDDTLAVHLGYVNRGSHCGELASRILDLIRSLPGAYRETLILRLVEGMTGPEIADRIGITPGSVRVNLHRGMQLLRARLSRTKQRSQQETP